MRSRLCPGPCPPDNPCASAGGHRLSIPNGRKPSSGLSESPRRPVSKLLSRPTALSHSEAIVERKAARPIPRAGRTSPATRVRRAIGKFSSAGEPQFPPAPWLAVDARTTPGESLSWHQTPHCNGANDHWQKTSSQRMNKSQAARFVHLSPAVSTLVIG